MKANRVICRLTLPSYGGSWIEAREIKKGFSVFFWEWDFYPKPTKFGQVNAQYNWKEFADFLASIEEGFIADCDIDRVKVEGESGLASVCLKFAWAQGNEFLYWLQDQDDSTFQFIEANLDIVNDDADIELLSGLLC